MPDYRDTLTHKIVQYEVATETMMAYVGHLNTEVMKEQEQPKPNQSKIDALEEQLQIVLNERHAILPDNERLIARAIYVYAPIMKALDRS
ncbi:MAG: hypothetical protein IT342_09835 [Candidatus Melainabacteria bacterium]|nr:hypothetical protein [Candidatus Melainabacteria bacterium]